MHQSAHVYEETSLVRCTVILIMFEARIPCFERWSVVVKSFLSNATVSSDAPDQKPSLARVLGRPMAPHLAPVELDKFSHGHISQTAKCWSAFRSLALAMLTRVGEAQERPTGGQGEARRAKRGPGEVHREARGDQEGPGKARSGPGNARRDQGVAQERAQQRPGEVQERLRGSGEARREQEGPGGLHREADEKPAKPQGARSALKRCAVPLQCLSSALLSALLSALPSALPLPLCCFAFACAFLIIKI